MAEDNATEYDGGLNIDGQHVRIRAEFGFVRTIQVVKTAGTRLTITTVYDSTELLEYIGALQEAARRAMNFQTGVAR